MAGRQLSTGSSDGLIVGQSSTDLVGFYGATPVARPSVSAAATDSSGGTASSIIAAFTATYNSTLVGAAVATLQAQIASLRSALVTTGYAA